MVDLLPVSDTVLLALEREWIGGEPRTNTRPIALYEIDVADADNVVGDEPLTGSEVLVDWGTGGGLPAIPLAIAFPDVTIHAVDAVGKKIQAVHTMALRLGLSNLHPWHGRAEAWPGAAIYSVARATAPLRDLWRWHIRARDPHEPTTQEHDWRPGLICLKGGALCTEINMLQQRYPSVHVETTPLEPMLGTSYFSEKYIVEVFDNK